jgi:hypothetical protein
MPEEITIQELQKVSRNLERLAEFIGARRGWTLASGDKTAATYAREAGESLSKEIAGMTDGEIELPSSFNQPSLLEPSGRVSAKRLSKFADFMVQLQQWFASHKNINLPAGSEESIRSIQGSLGGTSDALGLLLESAVLETISTTRSTVGAAESSSAPTIDRPFAVNVSQPEAADGPEPLTSVDLGPVADVDRDARLILDHTKELPLLQNFQGVAELTVEAEEQLDSFLAEQGVELGEYETHRIHDKVLRWIEAAPTGNVLTIKISGLFGKPEAYSSYQPRETVIPDPDTAD